MDMGAFEFTTVVPADFDQNGYVNSNDTDHFRTCMSGPMVRYTSGCAIADFDNDGDVDQSDFGLFQRCLGGAGDPYCTGYE